MPAPLSLQMIADIGLRGGAVALLCLLAVTGLRAASQQRAATVLFDVCAIAYLVETAPGLRDSGDVWLWPLRLLSMATPAVYLVWAQAAFSDDGRSRLWRWWPVAVMAVPAVWALLSDAAIAWRCQQAVALGLTAAGILQTLAGRDGDLVEARRQERPVFACGLGLCIIVTTVLGAAKVTPVPAVSLVLAIVLTAALLRLRVHAQPVAVPVAVAAPMEVPVAVPEKMTAEDRALHARLCGVMAQERAYREGGLAVASLAGRLGVPEYRLRRLINQHLGHRNFASFVNQYRLDEAMAALADPAQARVPVLTIALDCGFQSIGPFNRAFKARTGATPTEFRNSALAGIAAVT